MKKGHWLYLIVLISQLILMALPGSTSLLSMSLNNFDKLSWHMFVIDGLAILIAIAGYIVMRHLYKSKSIFVKFYPYFALVIALLWSIVLELK